MKRHDIATSAAAAISIGGQETLIKPPRFACAREIHRPFHIMKELVRFHRDDTPVIRGEVRTFGSDFSGDRTDIHDVFSLIWGAVLRAFGLCSAFLVDEPHVVVEGEIGARHLLLLQCPWSFAGDGRVQAIPAMNAWSAFAFHLLEPVFRLDRGTRLDIGKDVFGCVQDPKWTAEIARYLRSPRDLIVQTRRFPLWSYVASHKKGITVIRMPKGRIKALKSILAPYAPETARGEKAYAIFANGVPNAVAYTLEKKARKLLSVTGDAASEVRVLPLDSHCLFIAEKTIVALRAACGRQQYELLRRECIERNSIESRVFFTASVLKWKRPIHAGEFEDLCVDIIRREPGVIRAKLVGTTNDRDGGRDIIIDWAVPSPHLSNQDSADRGVFDSRGTTIIRIIAQIKTRSKTIGKRDVQDIRDTIEFYDAKGFLLIAHPRISSSLLDHLDGLGVKHSMAVDWWEDKDIDERLRRHPDIAKRYPNLVTLCAEE